jgi:DNA-directed RNA polymerase subunit M/transcription elongation factor TFIIS
MSLERASGTVSKRTEGEFMIYRLTCRCGTAFKVDERVIGRHFKCAGCQRRIRVDQVILEEVDVYRLTCECGTVFRAEDKAIGGTFRCPNCQRAVRIDRDRLTALRSENDRVPKSPRLSLPVEFRTGGAWSGS